MLRWGLVSTARINDRLLDAVARSERSQFIAVASRDGQRARAYADRWELPIAFGSYAEMLECDELDAVYISLPNDQHAEWSVRFADAGKHVLCEKPLALSTAEVDEMMAAAARNSVVIQEALATRFHPQTARVAGLIAGGTLGRVIFGEGVFDFTMPNTTDIRLDPELGGGAMWDVGCYVVAFYQAVLREDPVRASAHAVWGPTGVDLAFAGSLSYPSGACVQFTASMITPVARLARIVGEQGTLILDQPWLTNIGALTTVQQEVVRQSMGEGTFGDEPGTIERTAWDHGPSDVYIDQLTAFEDMVISGVSSPYPLRDSRTNVAVITALLHSARTGEQVTIPRS